MVRADAAEVAVIDYLACIRLPADWRERTAKQSQANTVDAERTAARLERAKHLYLMGDISDEEEYSILP